MTFPLATLACTIDTTGISSPSYADILASLQASYKVIYGADAYIDPDSQDGQWIAILAKSFADQNDATIACYNAFSPNTAQGAGLSSLVKINGIARLIPSNSQVDVTIVGQVGASIVNGKVADQNGNQWSLPSSVTIPPAGFIVVTATCDAAGAISASVGSVNQIATPSLGWQSVSNASVASTGAPVESDATLRIRQTQSTAQPSQTVLAGILGAVKAVTGVTQAVIYENDTGSVDADGLPAHSIAAVVIGGDATAIATAIMLRKTPGAFTYGSITVPVEDSASVVHNISFFVPTEVDIKVDVTIKGLSGYTGTVGTALKQAIADYINALPIGQDVYLARLYLPAQFNGTEPFSEFELQSLQISINPAATSTADVDIAFNARAVCSIANITLTVT